LTELLASVLQLLESATDLLGLVVPIGAHAARFDRPLDEVEFVVLDTELTGLDPEHDELLAIGAVRMTGTRIHAGETFERLVRPARASWAPTVPIHRIRPADVRDAPTAERALPELVAFCAGRTIVAHVANLDRKFLRQAWRRLGRGEPPPLESCLWLDTSRVAWWLATDGGKHEQRDPTEFGSLEALAARYAIAVPRVHHALSDAFVTAQVWQRQLAELGEHGVRTLRELARIGHA
jgi:DNA polymerase-3 subunit epsilon